MRFGRKFELLENLENLTKWYQWTVRGPLEVKIVKSTSVHPKAKSTSEKLGRIRICVSFHDLSNGTNFNYIRATLDFVIF